MHPSNNESVDVRWFLGWFGFFALNICDGKKFNTPEQAG
jgi:hypothetical protein